MLDLFRTGQNDSTIQEEETTEATKKMINGNYAHRIRM